MKTATDFTAKMSIIRKKVTRTGKTMTDHPIRITDEAMQALHHWGSPESGPQGENQWPALMRMLDREQPDYRN